MTCLAVVWRVLALAAVGLPVMVLVFEVLLVPWVHFLYVGYILFGFIVPVIVTDPQ